MTTVGVGNGVSGQGLVESAGPRRRIVSRSAGVLCFAMGALTAFACNDDGTGSAESDVTGRTTYVDLGDFVSTDADIETWLGVRRQLDQQFDDTCGDTFCEGDWSNLESLGYTCSVSSKQGRMRECVWTFAASEEQIDAATGSIAATVPFFECRTRPTGTARNFLPAFGDDPINATLPGLDGSLFDSLSDCFDAPIDATPLPEPTEGVYADARDRLEGSDLDAWLNMAVAVRTAFDQECGDSFCEGEYTNLQALRFRCSENTETGKIGSCAWSFAGSNVERDSRGFIDVTRAPFTCTFGVDATPAELANTLFAAGDDILRTALPNSSQTLVDVLIDCL